jgi:hypothetical protein
VRVCVCMYVCVCVCVCVCVSVCGGWGVCRGGGERGGEGESTRWEPQYGGGGRAAADVAASDFSEIQCH